MLISIVASAFAAAAMFHDTDIFVECESFGDLGGWVVDAYSMRNMGSSYVMAHGYGRPVADAKGSVVVAKKGVYAVWAKTRNWNAEWTKGAAGQFKVKVNGSELSETLGVGDGTWSWRKAGEVELPVGRVEIALHDLTGFNGRCDALFLTTQTLDPAAATIAAEALREAMRGNIEEDRGEWDMVVVGGGVAGCCAALSASRYGLKTLLLQDRSVLGGCNSSEIRVSAGGFMHTGPYPALGNVLEEILPVRGDYVPLDDEKFYEDDRKANAFSFPNATARLKLNKYVYAVETNGSGRVVAVVSRDVRTGRNMRHRAKWFVDATGDGVVARLAGCETMYGREARSRWNEACAPEKADRQVMGHSIQWMTRREKKPVPFPDIAWSLPFTEETVRYVRGGCWWQEAGQYRDMAEETESIRDYGLLAIFSNWNFIKNHSVRRREWETLAFGWISPIGGKRESHRVVGDYVLTETDLEEQRKFDDGTAVITWDIDFHFPDPDNARQFREPFRSCAYHRGFGPPVAVPYRCLYAKDAPNLFLAGRDISTSHGAFAAVRVQRTLGMLGEVVGIAAGICKEKGCDPRDVYATHLSVLKDRMAKGVPKQEQYCTFGGGLHEKYHFADLGFIPIWPNPATNIAPHTIEAIRSLGMPHRHRHPLIDEAKLETVPSPSPFRVVAWNVGHHARGIGARPTIPPGMDETYRREYREFIGDARVVGICEYSEEFSTNSPVRTVDALFSDYDVKLEGTRRFPQGNSLFFKKCRLIETKEREYPKRKRAKYYKFARVEMDGREVCVIETHLDFDTGPNDPLREARADQMRTIIADMANEKYVIICGDFNISSRPEDTKDHAVEYDVFAKAGYAMANRGQLMTWPSYRNPKREQPLDNIIVKGFEISDVEVKSSERLSDHKMLSCNLRFLEGDAAGKR